MLRLIVCDWNGTLFRDYYEEDFFLGLCRVALLRAIRRGRFGRALAMANAGLRGGLHYLSAVRNPEGTPGATEQIAELLNAAVFHGLPRSVLEKYTRRYARRASRRLDRRLLDRLHAVRMRHGVRLGVVSSGCRRGIEAALAAARRPADFIVANDFRFDGPRIDSFELRVMRNKDQVLRRTLAAEGVDPREAMYVGDSLQDAGCFGEVGWPVLSFWARPADRSRYARDGGVYIPRTPAELERHLQAALDGRASRPRRR